MIKYPFQPDTLDSLPEELSELFRGLELTLLQEICSRLNLADQLNEVTVQSIRALRSHGIDLKDIEKAIRDVTGISQKKLDKLLDDVVARNQTYYRELITLAKVTEPQTLVDQADIDAIKAQCQREFGNITRSMGFLVDNGRTMLKPAQCYQHVLDSALLKVQSGAISYNEAIRGAVRELADSGLMVPHNNEGNWVQYESGWYNRADVAARRAVMTAVVQVNAKYREQSMDYLDTDLVEVTAHSGARDTGVGPANHKSWQGKIYRWSEKPRTSQGEYNDFIETTGYGTGEGLCGWNCRHSFFPFLENVMEPTYTQEQLDNIDPPPVEYDGKTYTAYESTQAQRRIEASIRRWKRRKIAAEASGDKDDATAAGARLRALNKKYREFSKAAGLPEQRERMRVEWPDDRSTATAEALRAQRAAEAPIREAIKRGDYPLTFNPEKQARHMFGTATPGRSVITIPQNELQEIINSRAGNGSILLTKDFKWKSREIIDAGREIGYTINKNGDIIKTRNLKIHYSKTGVHVVPFSGRWKK